MLKPLITALALWPGLAPAQSDLSTRLAETGLAATEAYLRIQPDRDASTEFAFGGVLFLRSVEIALQRRWQMGIMADASPIPMLRLPIPPNPTPEPFRPDIISTIFGGLSGGMRRASQPLERLGDKAEVRLQIALNDLWFDIDMNGARGPGEGVVDVAGLTLGGRPIVAEGDLVVDFDTADAAWLHAYAQFLAGISELVLAFDPTPQIERVLDAAARFDTLAADTPFANQRERQFAREVDLLAMTYFALRQQPDRDLVHRARDHFLAMIAANRVFWSRAAAETDDGAEWIPNDSQTHALGLEFPQGTGGQWQAVLADAEALMRGRKLMPHWRLREGAGIDLAELFENPVPVDLPEWLHGVGLLPYAREGERVTAANWRAFERMMRGDTVLFVLLLN